MTRQNKIVVFSEITLSKEAVKQYLPETVIKPSIKTGDLIQACKEGFEVAVIIDGVFDFISSVWHKEILWVMAQGMDVIGCASMGALRAAELYTYGMKGSGYVFEAYKSGLTDDDSEVAVNFYQLDKELMTSIALINIRYTLDILKQEGCDQVMLDTTWQKTSAVFYKKRTWPYLQDQLTPEAFNLLKTHYVDIKAWDARQCLQSLPSLISTQQKIVTVPQTLFLNKLIRDIYYQDDIQAIADILQKHYIQAPQYIKDPREDKRAEELEKLMDIPKDCAGYAITLINKAQCRLTSNGMQQSIKRFRQNANLITGNAFKAWCIDRNLAMDCIEQTFADYLLLRRLTY